MSSDHAHHHAAPPCGPCCAHAPATTTASAPTPAAAAGGLALFHIAALDCPVEEAQIRRALEPLTGIGALHFDLPRRQFGVKASGTALAQALAAIRALGFDPQPLAADAAAVAAPVRAPWLRYGSALAGAAGAEAVAFALPAAPGPQLGMALALVAIALAGLGTYRKGLAALRRGRLDINALMAVAVTGAFAIGQWAEAAMVMALYAVAELIEAHAVERSRGAIAALLRLAPDDAEVLQPDGGWRRGPLAGIAVGARLRLRPGERVPLDGRVTAGHSGVDQSAVTGESLPVDKGPGDALYAGTLNGGGALEVEVTAAVADSTLARIVAAVEQAQANRAASERFVDRFAAVYTPAVFAIALAVAVLGPFAAGWTWLDAIYRALVLLVIACPCALVISTPVTIVSGLTAAARRGVLIKGGVHLETARRLKAVALDKTGTLTEGRPALVEFVALDGDDATARRGAAALAARSDHPVARAIAAGLAVDGAAVGSAAEVEAFAVVPGRGVTGRIAGRDYRLGKPGWIAVPASLRERLAAHEAAGRTLSLLADADGRVLAAAAVADRIKPSSARAIAELHALGLATALLSGDHRVTAHTIAAEAGIADARGDLLPEDKLAAIAALRARHGPTAMVGDGINDAPALARADLGIAMGAIGSDTAMETADVVVMNDELARLPEVIRLARRAHGVLMQNIALALGIKAAFLGAALLGVATMWMAVFADVGASLLVVVNGLRLLRGKN